MSGPHFGGQGQYPQQAYGQQDSYGAPQQQGFPPQNPGYPASGAHEFGPPRRQDSYGPPQAGGFQHGHEGGQFGQYNASNPQGQAGY